MRPLKNKLTAPALVALAAVAAAHAGGGPAAAAREGRQCPRIVVECPDRVTPGEAIKYAVRVEGLDGNVSRAYRWTTSAGTITTGQGTAAVGVDTTGLPGLSVEATVEVEGLPEGCPKTASCATAVPYVCILYRKYDEYGDLALSDERARLDNFAAELLKVPGAQGYVIAYGGRVGRAGEAQRRAGRVRDYLAGKTRGVDASRIVTVDGGYREEPTVQLYVVATGGVPPAAEPTVDPTEVKFVKEAKTQGRKRRR